MLNYSDEQLIARYLKGDEKSLEFLIKKYLKPIYNFVYHYTEKSGEAEDITQETFARLWRHLKKFDPNQSFRPWLFAIARNTALDFLKKKKAAPFAQFTDADGRNMLDATIDDGPLPDEVVARWQTDDLIVAALKKLPPKYQSVLRLKYWDNLNFREISEAQKKSLNTVKSQHRRAVFALKKILAKSL